MSVSNLKTRIKAQAAELARHKADHQSTSRNGGWQYQLWQMRQQARAALLVYAFLRGVEYARVERPRPDHKPSLYFMAQFAVSHDPAPAALSAAERADVSAVLYPRFEAWMAAR
jgi:hypothetical protein